MGMAIGIALTAAIVTSQMGNAIDVLGTGTAVLAAQPAAELVAGMALAMRAALVLTLIGAALSWFFRDEPSKKVERSGSGG